MIKIFRKIRQNLLTENKTGKYFKYAIGEIVLVVIGILIALSINNWNENNKNLNRVNQIRKNLLDELNQDLNSLDIIDSVIIGKIKAIGLYTEYFNKHNRTIDSILYFKSLIHMGKPSFATKSFTLDEIVTSGDIKLFTDLEKKAIRILKETHSTIKLYEANNLQYTSNFEFKSNIKKDLLYEDGSLTKEHSLVKGWSTNPNSEQYLLFHNNIATHKFFFRFLIDSNEMIRTNTKNLITAIEKNSTK